jgi:hypothetical protein
MTGPKGNTVTEQAEPQAEPQTTPDPSGFEPVDSQEKLNAVIGERLKRQQAQYGGSPQEIKAALAKLEQLENAQKSESERAADALAAAERKAEETASRLRAKTAENALITAASGKLRVPSDAVLHLGGKVEVDDEGNVDPNSVGALIDDLLTSRPDLAATQDPRVPVPNPAQGTSSNGSGSANPRAEFAALFNSALTR